MAGRDFERDYHETWSAFRARVTRALRSAIERVGDTRGDSPIVTSGGVIATAYSIALDLPDARVFPLSLGLANVGIARFAIDGDALRIVTLNDFGWLETRGR